jgi:hypothetical protein
MKPWYQSKTLAVNALILLLAVLDAAQALPIPATWAPYIIAAASVLNVVLRLTTNTGLSVGTDPAYRAAHDASGDPTLPNGGHPRPGTAMRAAPAQQDAPPAETGAPSLMETLAADNGIDPQDITPEDTV